MRRLKNSRFKISGTRENSSAITRHGYARYRTVCREDCEGVSGVGVGYRAVRVAGNKKDEVEKVGFSGIKLGRK
ncbi:unnamed protein product [Lasius platythorax]|uniref:Uncharacterized protein n=1 Tax=Lasius platythorax TaxID=488582 RepID=A0AAV2NMQ7_9HYME